MEHQARSKVAIAVRRSSQRHVGEDDLESYSRGELAPGHAAAVKKHLLRCAQCRNGLHEVEEYASFMRQALLELSNSDGFASRRKHPWPRSPSVLAENDAPRGNALHRFRHNVRNPGSNGFSKH